MRNLRLSGIAALALALAVAACATAPKTAGERSDLQESADTTLSTMRARDPGLNNLLASAAGYAVFPKIGKGGLGVGAAYGRGVLYEGGRVTGFVELNQGSAGLQIGAQTFSELVVLRAKYDVERLKRGQFSIGANASAVVLTTGAAASADFVDGVAVFVMSGGGAMAELSVSGQQINYEGKGG